jgi:hypothetical protein
MNFENVCKIENFQNWKILACQFSLELTFLKFLFSFTDF